MASRMIYLIKRELPTLALRVFIVGGAAVLLVVFFIKSPSESVDTPKVVKPNNYAFDSCIEAMRRDGNGLMRTADECGKLDEAIKRAESTATDSK